MEKIQENQVSNPNILVSKYFLLFIDQYIINLSVHGVVSNFHRFAKFY